MNFSDDPERIAWAEKKVRESRLAQGLPEKISDPHALIAVLSHFPSFRDACRVAAARLDAEGEPT